MKHILIYGEDLDRRASWGGIIDIEKDYPTPEEVMLFDAVKRAQMAKNTPWAYSEVSCEVMNVDSYEKFPFTGTVEDTVQIYMV